MKSFSLFFATRGGMDHRTDRHLFITSIRCGQAHRGKTFPLAEAADALRYLVRAAPSQGRAHNLTAFDERRRDGYQ